MSDPSLVQLQDISKSFRSGEDHQLVLDRISLSIHSGDFMAIAAPSGSGKSTLLNILGLLLAPDQGRYWFRGEDLAKLSEARAASFRAEHMGFVFQSFFLLPALTALENVEYALSLKSGLNGQKRREVAKENLALVGLGSHLNKRPRELSGGQCQRVAIARAIAARPELILADEPTANLDQSTGEEVIHLMQDLNKSRGCTFVFSTHDPRIMKQASRLLILKNASLVPAEDLARKGDEHES